MTIGITLLIIGFCSIIKGIVFIKNAKQKNIQISETYLIQKFQNTQMKRKIPKNLKLQFLTV